MQVPLERVHDVELKAPDPLLLKATVPVGVVAVPGLVSETLAWHTEGEPLGTGLGEHRSAVEVERGLTCRLKEPALPWWSTSLEYVAVIVCPLPEVGAGVKLVEQEPVESSEHVEGVNVPGPLAENVSVPVGVIGTPWLVSETVAPQDVGASSTTGFGAHVVDTEVDLWVTDRPKGPLLLVEWSVSPVYVPAMLCGPSDPGFGV